MKISIIGSRGYPIVYSGYETLVKELSERLTEKCDVTVYCHKGLFKSKPKKINNINLIYSLSVNSKIFSQFVNSFFSTIHACFSDTDVILFVNVSNGPFGILTKIFKKKTVINVDGMEWERPKWKGLGSLYFKFGAKLASKYCDRLITDCNEMRNTYLSLFKIDSDVIAYGPNKNTNQKSDVLEKFNLEKEKFYLIIGRLIPDNNADTILNEFISSKSKKKLVIVGDVPYKDKYASTIKNNNNNNVVFTGYVNNTIELADLYKSCFAYVHGHEFGGTNPTMINAINYGCAIIAHDNRFNREMLNNGDFGTYFTKKKDSLKNIINYCDLDIDFVESLKENKRKEISKKYEWNFITKSYLKIFNSLME